MSRTLARARPLWGALLGLLLLVVLVEVVAILLGASGLLPSGTAGVVVVGAVVAAILLLTVLVGVAPRADAVAPVALAAPVRGTWTAVNSPGQGLPSHGTRTRGQYCAVDVCGVAGPDTPPIVGWGLRGDRPEAFPGYGEPVHAMAGGTVVRASDGRRDHRARNTWPTLALMVGLEGLLREVRGTPAILGNHVVVAHDDGTFAAYAHLRRGTLAVGVEDRVGTGQVLGRVGNTGNSSVPHLHVQLMDRANPDEAAGLAMTWHDVTPTGDLDPAMARWAKPASDTALTAMPRNAEVFRVE